MALRIGIHTWGGEGDIRPFLALAAGLAEAGHEVRLVCGTADGRDYAASLEDARFEHKHLTSQRSLGELYSIGAGVFANGIPMLQLSRIVTELLNPMLDELAESAAELAQWADVLVLHPMAHPLAAAAEAMGKPFVSVKIGPIVVTRAFPPPGLPHLGALNPLAWKLTRWLLSAQHVGTVNRVRARFGLTPVKSVQQQLGRSVLDLVAMSPTVLPRPYDWPEKVHLTGFLNPPPAPRKERLAPELRAFLADGPAPVYVTFGSMSGLERNPHMLIELTEEALAAAGCRAIVQTDLPAAPSSRVFRVGAVAHDQVLPRCSAMIHHGGAGTSQAALLAGRPSVVVAHITDQFTWGRRLHKLGVAPPHLSRAAIEPESLLRAIEKATQDPAMRARAERIGQQMRQEDGVKRAVELITGVIDLPSLASG